MLGVGLSLTGAAASSRSGTSIGSLIQSLYGNGEQGAFFVAKPKVMRQQALYQSAQEIGPDGDPLQALELDGTNGTYASTPHSEAVDITGDLTLVAKIAPEVWDSGSDQTIIAKREGAAHSFQWRLVSGGVPRGMFWYGPANNDFNSYTSPNFAKTDGEPKWLACTLSFDAGTATIRHFVADDGASWLLTGDASFAQDELAPTASAIEVGSWRSGGDLLFNGRIYRAQVYSGAGFDLNSGPTGTLVADFNAEDPDTSDRSWQSSTTGETWTLHGNATIGIAGTPALEPGDPVGVMLDLSGNAKQARQFIAADRPTLQAGVKGPHLFNDGINKSLLVNLPDLGNDATLFYANKAGLNLQGRATPSGELDVLRGEETYLFGIVDRALTSQEEGQLRRMLEPKHGGTVPAMVLDGSIGTRATSPASPRLEALYGDFVVRAKIKADEWASGSYQFITSRYGSTSNLNMAFGITGDGRLHFRVMEDGSSLPYNSSAPPVIPDTVVWLAAALDLDDGEGSSIVRFYLSEDGEEWTEFSQSSREVITALYSDSGLPIAVGGSSGGSVPLMGKVYRMQIFDGLGPDGMGGTLIADFNPADSSGYTIGGESFTSSATGEEWTLNGNAMIGEYPA